MIAGSAHPLAKPAEDITTALGIQAYDFSSQAASHNLTATAAKLSNVARLAGSLAETINAIDAAVQAAAASADFVAYLQTLPSSKTGQTG